jgi:PAN domain
MRPSWMLAIAACLVAPAFADAPMSLKADAVAAPAPVGHEQGLYRFGATYNVIPSEDALSCQTACAEDAVCLAWSFVSAAGDAGAWCELKRSGGQIEHNPMATSGFSPRHEAIFMPVAAELAEELLGDENGSDADHIKAITVEIEKVEIDGPTDLTEPKTED